jgi:hypothetical protein
MRQITAAQVERTQTKGHPTKGGDRGHSTYKQIFRKRKPYFPVMRAWVCIALAATVWMLTLAGIALADDIIVDTLDDEDNTNP